MEGTYVRYPIVDRHIHVVGNDGKERVMSKSTRQTGKTWTPAENKQLRELARGNTPTGVIGLKLGRTKDAIRSQASRLGVSLKPTNQSPYNRRGK